MELSSPLRRTRAPDQERENEDRDPRRRDPRVRVAGFPRGPDGRDRRGAGIGKATLYRYFGTKEDLYFATILQGFDELHAALERPSPARRATALSPRRPSRSSASSEGGRPSTASCTRANCVCGSARDSSCGTARARCDSSRRSSTRNRGRRAPPGRFAAAGRVLPRASSGPPCSTGASPTRPSTCARRSSRRSSTERRVTRPLSAGAAALLAALSRACASGTDAPKAPESPLVAAVRSASRPRRPRRPSRGNAPDGDREPDDLARRGDRRRAEEQPRHPQSWLLTQSAAADVSAASARRTTPPSKRTSPPSARTRALSAAASRTSPRRTPGSASLNWLLLDLGGRGADVEEAKRRLWAADFAHNATMNDLMLGVAQAYYLVPGRPRSPRGAGGRASSRPKENYRGRRGEAQRRRRDDRGRPPGAHGSLAAEARVRPGAAGRSRPYRGQLATALGVPVDLPVDAAELPADVHENAPSRAWTASSPRPSASGPTSGRVRARARPRTPTSPPCARPASRRSRPRRSAAGNYYDYLGAGRSVFAGLVDRALPPRPALHGLQDGLRHEERRGAGARGRRGRGNLRRSRSSSRSGTATSASRPPRAGPRLPATSSRAPGSPRRSRAAATARASEAFSISSPPRARTRTRSPWTCGAAPASSSPMAQLAHDTGALDTSPGRPLPGRTPMTPTLPDVPPPLPRRGTRVSRLSRLACARRRRSPGAPPAVPVPPRPSRRGTFRSRRAPWAAWTLTRPSPCVPASAARSSA